MASLATVYNRFMGSRAETASMITDAGDERFIVRTIPNEDIYLFVKDIDNTRVVREADPQARGAAWRLILCGGLAVALLIGVLLPGAYGRIAGYRMEALRQEQSRLLTERASLELEEARLLSPKRLEELAQIQNFIDPAPARIVYLDGTAGAIAMKQEARPAGTDLSRIVP
jgi:hypothetical protein